MIENLPQHRLRSICLGFYRDVRFDCDPRWSRILYDKYKNDPAFQWELIQRDSKFLLTDKRHHERLINYVVMSEYQPHWNYYKRIHNEFLRMYDSCDSNLLLRLFPKMPNSQRIFFRTHGTNILKRALCASVDVQHISSHNAIITKPFVFWDELTNMCDEDFIKKHDCVYGVFRREEFRLSVIDNLNSRRIEHNILRKRQISRKNAIFNVVFSSPIKTPNNVELWCKIYSFCYNSMFQKGSVFCLE